jgi:hypothetical protein
MTRTDMTPQDGHHPRFEHGHHKIDDVGTLGLVAFAVGLTILGLVLAGILAIVMKIVRADEELEMKEATPLLFADESGQYAGPSVYRDSPVRDDEAELERAARRLNSYGWIEPGKTAHIPIERAIALLAERGLPKVEAPADSGEPTPADAVRRARTNPAPQPPVPGESLQPAESP